jgi:hypothetical protein
MLPFTPYPSPMQAQAPVTQPGIHSSPEPSAHLSFCFVLLHTLFTRLAPSATPPVCEEPSTPTLSETFELLFLSSFS